MFFGSVWSDVILWLLITAYGATGIWNLIAYTPWNCDDECFIKPNTFNYTTWLISSLIFFSLWISQFKHIELILLTVLEMVVVILFYISLLTSKQKIADKQKAKAKEIKKRRYKELVEK